MSGRRPAGTGSRATGLSRLLTEDLRHMIEPRGSLLRWRAEVCAKVLLYPRVRAVVYYRWSQALARRGLMPLAAALQSRAIRGSGAELAPHADLGPGLCLVHSVGIVVGTGVVAGQNLRLYHGVTLGDGVRDVPDDSVAVGTPATARPRDSRHAHYSRRDTLTS